MPQYRRQQPTKLVSQNREQSGVPFALMSSTDKWDFYFCQINDAPASICLDLDLRKKAPLVDRPHLLCIGLEILEPGKHQMGEESDVKKLSEIEERINVLADKAGMVPVGRVRGRGDWQLSYYGRPEHEQELEKITIEALAGQDRGYRVVGKADPDWAYFLGFLWPEPERHQWILDRRVVDKLSSRGDDLAAARLIDHRVQLPVNADVEAFVDSTRNENFEFVRTTPNESDASIVSVHLTRSDALAQLEVHDAVVILMRLAGEHQGQYEGWGCKVQHKSS